MSNPTPTGHKHKTVFTTLANTVWHLCWHVPSQKKPPHKMESLLSAGRPQQKRTVISSSKQGLVDRLNWAKNQNWSGGRSRTARDKETMLNQPASPNFSCSTQDSLTGRRESVELGKKKKKELGILQIWGVVPATAISCHTPSEKQVWRQSWVFMLVSGRDELHWWLRTNGCNWNKSLTLLKESQL